MITILGKKRVIILGAFLGVNVLLGALVYLYLMPGAYSSQQELSATTAKISSVRSDINRMNIEFDQLAAQQARFDTLKKNGFFNNQSRNQAEKIFSAIQKEAGVIAAVADIKPGKVEDSDEAAKADHKILSSPVSIHIEALDSVDVFRYIYLLQRYYPGHIAFQNLMLERKSDVSGTVLRGIASGANPVLVDANIDILWRTMIPKDQVLPDQVPSNGQTLSAPGGR